MAKKTEADQIIELKKQIEVLTTKIEAQNHLIKIMRTMPGMRSVGVKDDVASISSRTKKKARRSVVQKAVDQQSGPIGTADGDGANAS
jgi:allophanate hydrolase subunit 1